MAWLWIGLALGNPYGGGSTLTSQIERAPFTWEVPPVAVGGTLELSLKIPDGFAVYRDGIEVSAAKGPVTLGEIPWPEAKLTQDPSDPTQYRALYGRDVQLRIPVTGAGDLELTLTHQGCREGLCWPPTTTTHTVKVIGG